MARGTVKWFDPVRGYGFIAPADGGSNVFVHISAVDAAGLDGLREGQRLNFVVEPDRKNGRKSARHLTIG